MILQAQPLTAGVDRAQLMVEAGSRPQRSRLILDYDTRRYPFAALLSRDVFKVQRLELLHDYLQQQHAAQGTRAGRLRPRDNVLLTGMMERMPAESAFYRLYHSFMLQRLAPLVGRGISYTSHPKMRVHLAGTPSVSSFHHDICVTKRIDQINFWMPFTDVREGATLWLESDYGKADFAPVTLRYGQVLIFDGGYLGHGSMRNDSARTRVSLDMRFSYKKATTRAEGVALLDHLARVLDPVAVREGVPI